MEKYSVSLNKFISDSGYCSRREADRLITEGRVFLNNRPAILGNRYTEGDTVEVDGSYITAPKKEKLVYMAFNKPVGITTTTDENIKGNIITYINYPKRIFPIGRLDKDSEGLIFMTNDGDIVNKILRAGNEHEKEYIVRVNKPITDDFLRKMGSGVFIDGTKTNPCKINAINRQVFKIVLTQGLNRQIRKMCEAFDYAVEGLKRVRIMNIQLGSLAPGKWRYLSEVEISAIQKLVKSSSNTKEASVKPKETFKNNAKGSKPVENVAVNKNKAKDTGKIRRSSFTPMHDAAKKKSSDKKKSTAKEFYSNKKKHNKKRDAR